MKKEEEQLYEERNDEDEEEEEDQEMEESNDIIDLDQEIQTHPSAKDGNQQEQNKLLESPLKNDIQINAGNLKDIDFSTVNKDELINFLLYSDQNPLKDAVSSKKMDNYSVNASKVMKVNRNYREIKIKADDPEIKNNDFNMAYSKVVNNLMNNATTNGDHPEILKILLSGETNTDEVKKNVKGFNKEKYLERVEKFLEKKNRNLEMINDKLHEEFNRKHTFNPSSTTTDKRKFEQFLEDQKAYKVRLSEKMMQLKEESTKKCQEEMAGFKIDEVIEGLNKNSRKIIEEKLKDTAEPAYLRLFNIKKENKKIDKIRSKSGAKDLKESQSSEGLKKSGSKPSLTKSVNIQEKINYLYNDAKKRAEKNEELRRKTENILSKNLEKEIKSTKNDNSKKFLMKKFIKQFQSEMEELENEIINESKTKENSDNNNIEKPIKKITFLQFCCLMTKLKFVSLSKDVNDNQKNKIEVVAYQNEKKLLTDIHDELKDPHGFMNVDDVFYFILSILNFYETYIIKQYKIDGKLIDLEEEENNNSQAELKEAKEKKVAEKENPEEAKRKLKQEEKEKHLRIIQADILKKIKATKKYGGLDENSYYIISLDKSILIHKENSLLCVNWNTNDFKEKVNEKKEKVISQVHVPSFKPKISKKSEEMGLAYRRKLQNDVLVVQDNLIQDKLGLKTQGIEEGITMKNNGKDGNNINYIDLLLVKKKKQENILALKKEEIEKHQLKDCTFKPKINSNYIVDYNRNSENKDKSKRRIEVLYKKGITDVMNKKDKTTDEYETEKNQKDCTFKPNLEKDKIIVSTSPNIYNKDLDKFAGRLKQGRIDREIRDSVNQRGNLKIPEKLKSNEKNHLRNSKHLETVKNNYKNALTEGKNDINIQEGLEDDGLDIKHGMFAEESIKLGEKDPIPLLIIDVSVRPGEKKKIYVYEGDTPESLTEKFAKENGVEGDVKLKLKNLIQKNMSRLLLKIEEETQSINSAKSFSTK